MISAKVLFFGATADIVGEREIEFDFVATNAAQALAEITEKFPALNQYSLLFAVNQEYADGAEKINDGDELAIFTAVSGG